MINIYRIPVDIGNKIGNVRIKVYFCTPFLQRYQEEKGR